MVGRVEADQDTAEHDVTPFSPDPRRNKNAPDVHAVDTSGAHDQGRSAPREPAGVRNAFES